jgi:hypothetical protein
LGMFWMALEWKILVYFVAILYVCLIYGLTYIWYILWSFGKVFPLLERCDKIIWKSFSLTEKSIPIQFEDITMLAQYFQKSAFCAYESNETSGSVI